MMIIAFQVVILIIMIGSIIGLIAADKIETKNRIITIFIGCMFGYIVSITI
jgi:hypothetical protein